MQTYLCLQPREWNGNQYIKGLHYTDYGDEAHKAFGEQARKWVAEGVFQAVEGRSPFHAAMNSKVAASGEIIKK